MRKVFLCLFLSFGVSNSGLGQENSAGKGATVAEARAALDLSSEMFAEAIGEPEIGVAFQSFKSKGISGEVAKSIDEKLKKRGLVQLAGASFTDSFSSVQYQKSGFLFILLVTPSGEPNEIEVNLQNYGNIDLNKLRKPAGIEQVYVQPSTAMYFCGLSVEEANTQCRELLEKDGWEWFGETPSSFFMRQNAVRIQVICSQNPSTQGKTAIQFATEQLSSSIPLIAELGAIGYSDRTMSLHGDSKLSPEEFVETYQRKLESVGWKAITVPPKQDDIRQQLMFRNEANESAELFFNSAKSGTQFELKFTAADSAEKNEHSFQTRAGRD